MQDENTQVVDASELIQDDHNFNKGTEEGNRLLHTSLEKYGAGRSVLIDKDNRIIAGNKTQQQAADLGMKVRIIETDGTELIAVKRTDISLDSKEGREMALLDNRTSQVNLAWDETELAAVEVEGFDPGEFGLDIENLPEAFSTSAESKDNQPEGEQTEQTTEVKEDDFDPDTEKVETICQRGDIWKLGEHRLMCGDSTDPADCAFLMDGEKANLVITDPPYNVAIGSKNKFLTEHGLGGGVQEDIINDKGMSDEEIGEKVWKPAFKNLYDFAEDDAAIYVSMPQGGTHMMMMMMMSASWQVKHELVWLKNAPTFSMGRLNYDYKHEPIAYGWKKKHNWYATETKTSILYFERPRHCDLHPTMKPVPLWAELISNSSKQGMIVSDYFGGSGTTIVACEQLHRKARLMELDPHYCDVIIARWEKLTGGKAEKISNVGSHD